MSLRQLFDDYELWRFESYQDPSGQPIEEWVKIADVKGTIRPALSVSETLAMSGDFATVKHVFYCEPNIPVERLDEIRQDGEFVGKVTAVYEPSRPIYKACRLEERQ